MVSKRKRDTLSNGREVPDPMPLEPAIGYIKQPTIAERLRAMVRSETLRREAEQAGMETWEEADDFDIEDDDTYEENTPYEQVFDPEPEEEIPSPRSARYVEFLERELEQARGTEHQGTPPGAAEEGGSPRSEKSLEENGEA